MASSTTHNALDIPIYGAAFNVPLVWLDADGDPTLPVSLDIEVSKDNGTFANASNAVVLAKEVGGATDSAYGYITLTSAEMTCDLLLGQAKDSTQKATPFTLRPKRLPVVRDNQCAGGGNSTATLDANASAVDDYYNGCIIYLDADTGAGQARRVLDYDGGTKVATVAGTWETNPDATTDYQMLATPEWLMALSATQTTILNRLGAWTGTGLNTILGAFRALAAKLPGLTPTDLSNGTTYDNTTDSQEGIRDTEPLGTPMRGTDGAYTGTPPNVQDIRDAMKLAPTAGAPTAGSVDKHLDDILEDTGTTLPALIGALSPGTGARTVTYTITDAISANPVVGVTMRYYSNSARTSLAALATGTTLGVVQAWLDDGTYYWAAKATGYEEKTGSLVVNGNENETSTMDPIVAPDAPADPDTVVIYADAVELTGLSLGADDATFSVESFVSPNLIGSTSLLPTELPSDASDANGRCQLTIVRGARVVLLLEAAEQSWRYTGTVPETNLEDPDDGTFTLDELVNDYSWELA